MPTGKYDPKLSQAGFMDLVVAIQAQLEATDATKLMASMPVDQREAARLLDAAAKTYVAVVEGRSVPYSESQAAAEKIVILRVLGEASEVLSRICADHDLGLLSEESMRVLGRCRAAQAVVL